MRFKKEFIIREVCGETVISGEGHNKVNFNKLMCINSTSVQIWNNFVGKDFTIETMADFLCDTYGISREKAIEDSKNFCDKLISVGVIE